MEVPAALPAGTVAPEDSDDEAAVTAMLAEAQAVVENMSALADEDTA
jgi:hypothetical protein